VRARIATAHAVVRRGAVLAWDLMVGASGEYFRPLGGEAGTWDAGRLERWWPCVIAWLTQEWGDANVVGAYLHLDETTPHIHALAVPIDPRHGRLSSTFWFGQRDAFSAMQDRHAAAVASLGLERGIKGSRATHTDLARWYAQMHSPMPEPPPAQVATPGLLFSARARQKWAERESARIHALQQAPLAALQTRARAEVEAQKRRREMEATARHLARQLEQARQQLAMQRPLAELATPPALRTVAALFELRELADRGIVLRRSEGGADQALDASGTVIAHSGIELVMHVLCSDRQGALTWLAGRAHGQLVRTIAVSSAIALAEQEAAQARVQALELPVLHRRIARALDGVEVGALSRRSCAQRLARHGFALVRDAAGGARVCEVHSGVLIDAPEPLRRPASELLLPPRRASCRER
jgi:hypothetical protein